MHHQEILGAASGMLITTHVAVAAAVLWCTVSAACCWATRSIIANGELCHEASSVAKGILALGIG